MNLNRTHIVVGELKEPLHPSDSQKILDFLSLQSNASRSFRADLDVTSRMVQCSQQIGARTAYDVWADASAGNAASCLELGLRLYTGCGASLDKDAALDWWLRISDPTNPNFVRSASRPLKAKALSCLASDYFEKSFLPDETLQIDDLYRAAQLADGSASLGFVSPVVLSIGARIERIGLRQQATCPFRGVDTSRFANLESLWRVADARTEEMNKKHQKREAKVSQAPNLYICAVDVCGIEGTSRSGLLQCSGKCPPDLKPSYCSKECQKADWKRHRVLCKSEAITSPKIVTPQPKKIDDTITGNMRKDGRELNIDVPAPGVPGGKFQLSSTTMSASWMKEFRDRLPIKLQGKRDESADVPRK